MDNQPGQAVQSKPSFTPVDTAPTIPPTPAKENKMKWFILFTVALLLIAGSGIYFFNMKSDPSSQSAIITETQPSPTSFAQALPLPSNSAENAFFNDTCNYIERSTFISVKEFETGLGPNGPVKGKWQISLVSGRFQWIHSDLAETGTYTCKDDVIKISFPQQSANASRNIQVRFEEDRRILIWDGIEYEKVSR